MICIISDNASILNPWQNMKNVICFLQTQNTEKNIIELTMLFSKNDISKLIHIVSAQWVVDSTAAEKTAETYKKSESLIPISLITQYQLETSRGDNQTPVFQTANAFLNNSVTGMRALSIPFQLQLPLEKEVLIIADMIDRHGFTPIFIAQHFNIPYEAYRYIITNIDRQQEIELDTLQRANQIIEKLLGDAQKQKEKNAILKKKISLNPHKKPVSISHNILQKISEMFALPNDTLNGLKASASQVNKLEQLYDAIQRKYQNNSMPQFPVKLLQEENHPKKKTTRLISALREILSPQTLKIHREIMQQFDALPFNINLTVPETLEPAQVQLTCRFENKNEFENIKNYINHIPINQILEMFEGHQPESS